MSYLFENIENEKDVFLEVDEFTSHLMSEMSAPEFAGHRDALKKELKTASINALKTQNELIAYNDKKYNSLKDYIASENHDIAILQNIANLLNKDISGIPRELIADTTSNMARSTTLLQRFNKYQDEVSIDNSVEITQDR